MCNEILKKGSREIDHIIPLSHDGTNDETNLQALCKECHYDKTQEDNEDHINISQTHSSFSNSVGKVMESNLNKTWAFVEKVKNNCNDKSIESYDEQINKLKYMKFNLSKAYYSKINEPSNNNSFIPANHLEEEKEEESEFLNNVDNIDIYKENIIKELRDKINSLKLIDKKEVNKRFELEQNLIKQTRILKLINLRNNIKNPINEPIIKINEAFDNDNLEVIKRMEMEIKECDRAIEFNEAEKKRLLKASFVKSSSIDINGCRRNILRFNKFDYPLFTVLDQFEIYNGQCKPGKYYVETKNKMPLRGNGFYFYPTIKYCLDNNIIKDSDIKYCLLSSMVTPHNYYNDFIDYCVNNINDSKLAINSMIGNFASKSKTNYSKSLMITEDLSEAFHYFYNNNKCFIDMKESERGNFYHIIEQNENINCETERIIYDMIVEMEALEMHKLKKIIKSKGGIVTEYKTDCIRFNYNGDFPFKMLDDKNLTELDLIKSKSNASCLDLNIDGYVYPDGKPMYKVEDKGELLEEHMKKAEYCRAEKFKYAKQDINIINDVEDNDFKPLIDKIINLDGCSIQGIAGSGKSTLINSLVKKIRDIGKDVTLLTPTNISSIIIGGQTLDKFHKTLRSTDIIKNVVKDYVIVDEVSMMKEIFYKMMTVIKKIKPETKIILVGHNKQFGPVKDRIGDYDTKFYFDSDVFHELVYGNKLILTKCRRSDDRHFKNCSNVNNVNVSDYGKKLTNFNICYTNKKRIEINKICMDIVKEKNKQSKKIELMLPKHPFSKISQDVYLTLGSPIISIKNKKDVDIVNGEMFKVNDIDKKNNLIYISNHYKNNIKIPINKFQQWFHIAYCITSHKSQGQTINKPYTIHDWDLMSETCKYVSLSRSSEYEYVNII